MAEFRKSIELECSAADLFDWHARAGAFDRLIPPFENVKVIAPAANLAAGEKVLIEVPMGPLRRKWLAELSDVIPGQSFRDSQLSGPFHTWNHHHLCESLAAGGSRLTDHVVFKLPLGPLGNLFSFAVHSKLARVFAWRHQVTQRDLMGLETGMRSRDMKVVVVGASGLVGRALVPYLTTAGNTVIKASRSPQPGDAGALKWTSEGGFQSEELPSDLTAVVHLAGENIAGGRWTDAQKERIRKSRVEGTRVLCEQLAKMESPPKTLVCASAIGYFGDTGQDVLADDARKGEGFLADVVAAWEDATRAASEAGIRVVNLRFGVILDPQGGALKKMLLPFKMGVGGKIGSGEQLMSWTSREDVIRMIDFALKNESLAGPVNAVAPEPLSNLAFTKTLGKVLNRPTIMPLPGFVAKALMGEMAEELLLVSAGIKPQKLSEAGYQYAHPDLEQALRELLGK